MSRFDLKARFRQAAARFPDREAVACGTQALSYAELDRRSDALAGELLETAAAPGEVTAILTDDRVEVIVAILACLKAGCAFAPLDPRLPDARLASMLAVVRPGRLLVEPAAQARAWGLMDSLAPDCRVHLLDGAPDTGAPRGPCDRAAAAEDPCYVYFTSGSTGEPKAIAGRLSGLEHFIHWEVETLGLSEGVRSSQLLPPSFDGSLRDIFVPLAMGGTVCVPPSRDDLLDAHRLVEWLDAARVEVVHCVPSLFRSVINAAPGSERFPRLKWILMAGEALLPADVTRWMDVFGERVGLVNLYGTSETTLAKFAYFVTAADRDRPSVPIGKPIRGAAAILLDGRGNVAPPHSVGEIYIRTPHRSLGYYGRPDLTDAAFVPNPFGSDPNDRVHRTGDLARLLDDGNFEYLGRRDRQVKIRGVRVEPAEVESVLRARDGVRDVAVVDQRGEDGTTYLAAYVVADDAVDPGVLRAHLATLLPEPMIPSAYVRLPELPRTISGKVDRRALPAPGAGGGWDRDEAAPRTPTEEVVASIWAQVLGRESLGVHAPFFEIGGHSLLATRVLSRVRGVFGVDVPLGAFFMAPTVAELAAYLDRARHEAVAGEAAPPLVPVERAGALPLSFQQQRLWMLDRFQPGNPAYNVPLAVRLEGAVDAAVLSRALDALVRRHEALRTVLHAPSGAPRQVVRPAAAVPLEVTDLSALDAGGRRDAALQHALDEARLPFDLEQGPLFRVRLLRLDEREHVLLATMHHVVSDGWSLDVFLGEVAALYAAAVDGAPEPERALAPLPVQYADYAAWQRGWLHGEALERQLAFWREALAGAPRLELPTDRPRPAEPSADGAEAARPLPPELVRRLRRMAGEESATLFLALLAGFKTLLHRYTRAADLVVGIPVANRRPVEVERLIGFFVNTLALRTDLSGNPSFREVLRRVRDTAMQAYAHQDVPFEAVVSAVRPERNASADAVFQVMFMLQAASGVAAPPAMPGVSCSPIAIDNRTAKFDLALAAVETADGWTMSAQYRTELFDAETVDDLLGHLECLLRAAAEDPDQRIADLPLMDETDAVHAAVHAQPAYAGVQVF